MTGFNFSLREIVTNGDDDLLVPATASVDDTMLIEDIEHATELDRGQCQALVAALTSEYALIQGPPGTGKSFLGVQLIRVLLSSPEEANLGPILVM